MTTDTDSLQRFHFIDSPVRGEIVRLNRSYLATLERHPYPLPIRKLLGETLVATTLLSAILKFSGSLILQVQGNNIVKLLVAQADHLRHIRGLAQWDGDLTDDSFAALVGGGQLVLTINPGPGLERYQGIVTLDGKNLADGLTTYFAQSEQLPTFIYLTADEQTAAGMLLQVLPGTYDQDPELAWQHLTMLSQTLTTTEMLQLPNQEILKRLFHEEDIELFEPEPVTFYCDCDRARMEKAILTLGSTEAQELIAQHKAIIVTCEFCNRQQNFDAVDVTQIFATGKST